MFSCGRAPAPLLFLMMPRFRYSTASWSALCAFVFTPCFSVLAEPTKKAPAARQGPKVSAPTQATTKPASTTVLTLAKADAIIKSNPAAALNLRLPTVYAPTRPRLEGERYPWKTNIVTTIFWIGEPSTGVTPACNTMSSWDTKWQITYGGYDDPDPSTRTWDFRPKSFVPNQNPFYIALPFNDLTNKEAARAYIPWYHKHPNSRLGRTVLKGRWVAVRFGKKICYAQWEDCGPFETDDVGYVFGKNPQPKTVMNNGAGLDVSPAVRDYLGIVSGVRCDWRFCEEEEVPDGPWRKFGANNPFVNSSQRELAQRIQLKDELSRQREVWLREFYNPELGN